LPSSIGNWVNYSSILYISDNSFTGTIPESFSKLRKLTGLWLKNCQLTGLRHGSSSSTVLLLICYARALAEGVTSAAHNADISRPK